MLLRKSLLLLLLFFCCAKGFAATFVVTSNADSGPGTLRDVLTRVAASDTTVLNYITFNIADQTEAGRTITISSQLPDISSNLVIDGTTQPGSAFGVSNAKIIVQHDASSNVFDAFHLTNVYNFQFYGLYVRDFSQVDNYRLTTVFYIAGSANIQIGAPGKGNVFANDGQVIANAAISGFEVSGFKFYSNLCGFEPDGVTIRTKIFVRNKFIDLTSCKGDIEIGGLDDSQRNYFGASTYNIMQYGDNNTPFFTTTINIINNYFDYDVTGAPVSDPSTFDYNDWIYMFGFIDYAVNEYQYPFSYNFINNKVQNPLVVWMYLVAGDVTFQGNQVLGGVNTRDTEIRLNISTTGKVQFGGDGPGQGNTIYNEQLLLDGEKQCTVLHNSIYCVPTVQWNDGPWVYAPSDAVRSKAPSINITKVTANSVSGTSAPGAEVQLFWDDDCVQCEPQTYVTTLYADQNGNWNYNGPVNKGVIATATLNGYTQVFTEEGGITNYTLVHAACGNNGAITGITTINSGGYTVTNSNGQVVGTGADIKNLPPGNYRITTDNGSCSSVFDFRIVDATPNVDPTYAQITQPSCGQDNGSITGLYVTNQLPGGSIYVNPYSFKWLDASNKVRGTTIDIGGLEAGTYRLEVTYDANPCTITYGPITLKNTTGPNIDQSNPVIQPSNCGQATGSITNIGATGTGTLKYIWWNSQQQTVGNNKDLTGVPAGVYKLEVSDESGCGAVYTTDITIPEANGITMNEIGATTTPASCNNNGSVTKIQVTGATQYQWTDVTGTTVGTQPDLINVPAGTYTLTASNTSGCSKTSKSYTVGSAPSTNYPKYADQVVPTCINSANGSVTIYADALVKGYRWVNSQGKYYGNQPETANVPADTYTLYLTDANGCETLYNSYTVPSVYPASITTTGVQVVDDQCDSKTGSVTGIQVQGGIPPYIYRWEDESGNTVSRTADLANVGAGKYTLIVTDHSVCGPANMPFNIQNTDNTIAAPIVTNLQVCSSGSAMIAVINPQTADVYNLYDDQSSAPVDQEKGGKFRVNVTGNTRFYITHVSGSCESGKSEVNVSVGLSSLDIANTFTPNGDGINDLWKINNIENYPQADVQIFTRDGMKIFESKGYQVPFDGTYKGQKLPVGVYYYIIDLHSKCSLLSGSLTIIR